MSIGGAGTIAQQRIEVTLPDDLAEECAKVASRGPVPLSAVRQIVREAALAAAREVTVGRVADLVRSAVIRSLGGEQTIIPPGPTKRAGDER